MVSRLEKSYRFLWMLTVPSFLLSLLVLVVVLDHSSNYIQPKIYTYDPEDNTFIFTREIKQNVVAEWTQEIVTIDGLECSTSGRTFYAKTDGPETITIPVPPTLLPCLTDGDYKHIISGSVIKWAGIRLRSVSMSLTRVEERLDLQSYKQRQLKLGQ